MLALLWLFGPNSMQLAKFADEGWFPFHPTPWRGVLFVQGEIYFHEERNLYLVSMGFREWMTFGIPLEKLEHGGQDHFFCIAFGSTLQFSAPTLQSVQYESI